ncbi:hypothetical protein [Actinomadura sediminis]|uniref:Glutathionylspermidine synthase pre-ATP-grasp-like domain-containing protein n=1 Tax=Actinomadura sediminis TaxID=1038904 RepID=A0ABW3EGQ7_9ACTN
MVTRKYLDACAADPALRTVMASAELPEPLAAAWGKHLLPRPMFCDEAEIRGAADDLSALFRLLTSLPDRLFGGDVRAFCAALGMDERRIDIMTRFSGEPILYGRADLYHDGSGYRLMEFNVGSELGGVDISEVNRPLLATPPFRAFAEDHGLTHVGTPAAIARQFVRATGKDAPVVATLEGVGGIAAYETLHRSFQDAMRRHGIDLVYGEVDQVQTRNGRLYLHGKPIDLVLRYYSSNQIARDDRNERPAETVQRAHEDGRVVLWTPVSNGMFGYKSCLAMLSECDLPPGDRALVDRVLPWTRRLTPELADRVRAERETTILKPIAGLSGHGVRAGWDQDDREWADTVTECLREPYIAQRRIVPNREPVLDPATGESTDWSAVWGVFAFPDGYGGAFCRAVPDGGDSVVNFGATGARVTPVLHH